MSKILLEIEILNLISKIKAQNYEIGKYLESNLYIDKITGEITYEGKKIDEILSKIYIY